MSVHTSDFQIENGVLLRYCGHDAEIIVPDGVCAIGGVRYGGREYDANADRYVQKKIPGAFAGVQEVRRVVLPQSVQSIGEEAFCGCSALEEITLPCVEEIGPRAFADCKKLRLHALPQGLRAVGEEAFRDCHGLLVLHLPDTLRSVGKEAFSYCRNLEELAFPDSVQEVGERICLGCSALRRVTYCPPVGEDHFCGSLWFKERMENLGRCPACGGTLAFDKRICLNNACPTNYGKWER